MRGLGTALDIALIHSAWPFSNSLLVAAVLGDVARARGISQIARETGLSRECLYKALNVDGNPEFGTVMRVIRALGLRLTASPAE
jgi:probable addiction module antidote protein